MKRFCATLFAFLYLYCFLSLAFAQANRYEQPPVLSASDVVPDSLLKGNYHTLSDRVVNDGYMNSYILKTKFGDFKIKGNYFLIKRISELDALAYLKENYASVDVAGKAAAKTAKGMLLGPVRGAKKLYDTATNTEKLKKTAKDIPSGIANLFSVAARAVGDAASYTYKTGRSVATGDVEETERLIDDGAEFVQEAALDYVGYNKAFMQTAKALKVDPYSSNGKLRSELRRVASLEASVVVGSKFAPSLYSIPGVGTANTYLGFAERAATYADPEEVEDLNRKILSALGKDSDSEAGRLRVDRLMENDFYSPPMRQELVLAIRALEAAKNVENLIEMSNRAKSREAARFYVASIGMLARKQKAGERFTEIIPGVLLPVAVSAQNNLIVSLAVDHLVWTEEVAKIFHYLKIKVQKHTKGVYTRVLITGSVSERCKQELKALGAKEVIEKVKF